MIVYAILGANVASPLIRGVGCDRCCNDVEWLHRDFGLLLVNVFDTSEAARALRLPNIGLAYLVKRYLGVEMDKTQRAEDWRLRPLPQLMLRYARSDTHFLLALHQHLLNAVLDLGASCGCPLPWLHHPHRIPEPHISTCHRHSPATQVC